MKLYTARASPFGRTVEVVARELGLEEDVEIVPTTVAPAKANAEYQAVTALRKIPAMVTEDGALVVDSTVIAEYLAARVGDRHLFARDAPDHFAVMTRYVLARGISECAVSARYENAARPEEKRWQGWVDDQMGRIEATLALFDAKPPEPSGRLTIADIALAAALGYLDFRFSDFGWREKAPRLVPWYEAVIARPSLAATRPE